MKKLLTFSIVAALACGLSTVSFAAEKKMKAAAPASEAKPEAEPAAAESKEEAKAGKPVPYHGDVAAVDAAAKTFTFKNKDGKERVFAVTDKTKITKDDAPADFAAITAGAYATGQYNKSEEGKLETVSVKIGPKPEKKSKAEGESKAEEKKPQ